MLQRICSILRIRPPLPEDRGLLSGSGYEVPDDGKDGWQTASVFQKTNGNDEPMLYVNLGSATSARFRPILSYEPE